jgi:secondary thiamine-phosphate synthase enzyme
MKVFNTSFVVTSEERVEFADITKRVREALQQFLVTSGVALVNTMHTTCALFLNEFQGALIDDVKALMERLVADGSGYRHNDPRYSDCERGNAQAHLRAALLGRSIAFGITDSEPALGRFQSIIFAEFDGPRSREVSLQVIGE